MKGIIFDIKQMALFDGPGLRTTVFFKGCPLRCRWCHNPEGQTAQPQLMVSAARCTGCGGCRAACPHPEGCTACGACAGHCPLGLRAVSGRQVEAQALARELLRDAALLRAAGGGYTLSGGEPLFQPAFAAALLQELAGSHRALETCGHCAGEDFDRVLRQVELVYLDIKLIDAGRHRAYTGVDNRLILANLKRLQASGVPHIIRIPLVPGVNDSRDNQQATAALLHGAPALLGVELLPYQPLAGAKYPMVGRRYAPGFDTGRAVTPFPEVFTRAGIACRVL